MKDKEGEKMSERRPELENYMEVKHSFDTMLDSDAHGGNRWEDNLKQIGALLELAKIFDLDGDLKDLLTNTENEMEITFPPLSLCCTRFALGTRIIVP